MPIEDISVYAGDDSSFYLPALPFIRMTHPSHTCWDLQILMVENRLGAFVMKLSCGFRCDAPQSYSVPENSLATRLTRVAAAMNVVDVEGACGY